MDFDADLVRFECLMPRLLRTQLASAATRNRRTSTAELIIALERHLAAESTSVAQVVGVSRVSPADQGHNGAVAFASAAVPTPSAPPGISPGGASPSEVGK